MIYVLTLSYLGIGLWWAIWARRWFVRDDEWLAAASALTVIWLPMVVGMLAVATVRKVRKMRDDRP